MPYYPPAAGGSRWVGPWTISAFDSQSIQTSFGDCDGGIWTLTYGGETALLDWDATAADLLAALEALPSIGVGNIRSVTENAPSVNGDRFILFRSGFATGFMAVDSSGLTGPSSPYGLSIVSFDEWTVPLVTLAAGDALLDLIHSIPENWTSGGVPFLFYADAAEDPSDANWNTSDFTMKLDIDDVFDNFATGNDDDVEYQRSAVMAMLRKPASAKTILPAVVSNAVTIYAAIDGDGALTAGLLRIWANVATTTQEA